jgi:hypothetical protein
MTSIDAMAAPAPGKAEREETGLHSPPETNMKDCTSDSELSELEPEPDTNELVDLQPDHYSADGSVPVFKPTMEEFADFQRYVSEPTLDPTCCSPPPMQLSTDMQKDAWSSKLWYA